MAYVTLDQSELSKIQLMSALEDEFGGRYEIQSSWLPAVHVLVRKSALTGIGLKLQRKAGTLRLRCVPLVPSSLARLVTGNGLLSWLFLRAKTKEMMREITAFASTPGALSGAEGVVRAARAEAKPASIESNAKTPNRFLTAALMGFIALVTLPAIGSVFGAGIETAGRFNLQNAAVMAAVALPLTFVLRLEPILALATWVTGRLLAAAVLQPYWGVTDEIQSWMSAFSLAQIVAMVVGGIVLQQYRRLSQES